MKTLYEILEVSESASKEIIEKAYKVLVKKYHPDLWPQDKKQYAEQKMKELNDAYDVLSNEQKRNDYDNNLKLERQKLKEKEIEKELRRQSENIDNSKANYSANNNNTNLAQEQYNKIIEELQKRQREQYQKENEINKKIQKQYEEKYNQAYESYLKNLGYKIKYKWTWKNYRDLLITILIIIIICTVLWFFPVTHKWIIDFYESNHIIKTIIDIIGSIFVGIWNAICSIFKF